jgi:hypothetical protein
VGSFLGGKWAEREAYLLPPASAEVKKMCVYIYRSTLPYAFMAQCLVKLRHDFTFHFYDLVLSFYSAYSSAQVAYLGNVFDLN